MAFRTGARKIFSVFLSAALMSLTGGSIFSENCAAEDPVAETSGTDAGVMAARYLEEAEQDINAGEFSSARKKLEMALTVDNGNKDARKRLARLDQEEAIQKQKKPAGFLSGLFSPGQRPEPKENPQPVRVKPRDSSVKNPVFSETKISRAEEYMAISRQYLEKEAFSAARDNAMKAAGSSEDKALARNLLLEIDSAEAAFRDKHGVPSGVPGGKSSSPMEEYLRERERYEARKKLEDLSLRENIIGSRNDLKNGDYEAARKKAYEAWKKVPYDTEVAILIADINKAVKLGPEGLKTDLYDGEDLVEIKPSPEKDPMTRHEESKSFPDLAPMLVEGIRGLYAEDKFEPEYQHPEEEYSADDCVEVALKSSHRVVFADEQVKLGEMRIWELRRKLFPDVALKVEKSFGKMGDTGAQSEVGGGGTRHYQGAKYMAEIKQNVFDGFGTYFEIRQAQSNLEVIKKERDRIRNEIIEETQRAYYSLDKTIKTLEIQNRILERIKQLFEITEKASQKELIPTMEFLKVKGQYLQSEFRVISSRRDMDLAQLVLVQAMNIDPDRPLRIKPLEKPEEFLTIGLQNCYNLALANNPDLIIKEKTIEYYDFERKMAKSKGWPKIDFTGNFGKAIEKFQPMRKTGDWTGNPASAESGLEPEWYAGIKGSIPIGANTFEYNYVKEQWASTVSAFRGTESATSYFTLRLLDNMAYFTGVQESRVGFERSKYEYQKAKSDVGMQVKAAFFKYKKSLLQLDVAEAQVEHQKLFVDILEKRRDFGEMDISTIIEEYVKLAEHEYSIEQGYTDYYISIMEINKSIGVMDYFHPWKLYPEERQRSGAEAAQRYVSMARAELEKERFSAARRYAVKAAEIDGSNDEIKLLLRQIDQAEGFYREGKNPGMN